MVRSVMPVNFIDVLLTSGDMVVLYTWISVNRGASISNANTPTPRIQFDAVSGTYTFRLTVTDARGATAESTISVSYYGR